MLRTCCMGGAGRIALSAGEGCLFNCLDPRGCALVSRPIQQFSYYKQLCLCRDLTTCRMEAMLLGCRAIQSFAVVQIHTAPDQFLGRRRRHHLNLQVWLVAVFALCLFSDHPRVLQTVHSLDTCGGDGTKCFNG